MTTSDEYHVAFVRAYFESAGAVVDVKEEDRSPGGYGDPLYAVWAGEAQS